MFSKINLNRYLKTITNSEAKARADIRGSREYQKLLGYVHFYEANDGGVLLVADVKGLPHNPKACSCQVFGFHIHEGSECTGNAQDPFANVGGHYNPNRCPHPQHAGDLPPLFENNGHAFMVFLTHRFKISDITGRTIVIHNSPDDFTTQPAGNSGKKIACGRIRAVK